MTRNADIDRELPYMMFDFLIDAAQEGNITQEEAVFLYHKWGFGVIRAAESDSDAQMLNDTHHNPNAA